jgi:hypothetical protein
MEAGPQAAGVAGDDGGQAVVLVVVGFGVLVDVEERRAVEQRWRRLP